MNDAEGLRIITGWVTDLVDVMNHGADGKPSMQAIAVLGTMLADDYPSTAFNSKSLRFVAQGIEWMPSYETIRLKLNTWWNKNKPAAAPRIVDDMMRGWSIEERCWWNHWHKRVAEGFMNEDGSRTPPGVVASIIRRHAPKVWDVLNPNAPAAANWEKRQSQLRAVWDDDEEIYALAFKYRDDPLALSMLRTLVNRWAPQHIDMVPPA